MIFQSRLIVNQPYDESVSIYDDEEVASDLIPTPRGERSSNNKDNLNKGELNIPNLTFAFQFSTIYVLVVFDINAIFFYCPKLFW